MKLNFTFLILVLMILSCKNQQKTQQDSHSIEMKSRIKNEDLKKALCELIKIQKITYPENPHSGIIISILSTNSHLYAFVSGIDCSGQYPVYGFDEKNDLFNAKIYVDEESINPERFIDLKNINVIPESGNFMICDDFYYVSSRFKEFDNGFKLERLVTIYDDELESIIAKEDSALNRFAIVPEPEPEPQPSMN